MSPEDTDRKETETTSVCIFNILCRIHTYFIHSHDVSRLSDDERKYIDNNFKYIESTFECVDGDHMAFVLRKNAHGVDVNVNELQHILYRTQYHMTQLMTDLCDIFTNKMTNDTLLPSIIIEALRLEDNDTQKQQQIYKILLCSGFITKTDLNHNNFIKMLKIAAFKVNPQLNLQEIEQIACDEHLTGTVCVKDTADFMNSLKFAKLFKSIKHWNKTQWTNIYVNIQKWTQTSPRCPSPTTTMKNKPNFHHIVQKYTEASIDYIDIGTDAHSIQTVCTLTNATKDMAFAFLQETSWNVAIAVETYFTFGGNINGFLLYQNNTDNEVKEEPSDEHLIYNDGVEFWYWSHDKEHKRYIEPKCDTLKDEILQFTHQMSMTIWAKLIQECRLLEKVDHIKQITHNGNHSNIYEISSGKAIDLEHLLSIKLYTDCTVLCAIFCKAFRFKQISP
eukprot:520361_1